MKAVLRYIWKLMVSCVLLASAFERAPAQGSDERQTVTIALQPKAQIDDAIIYLDQIAKLSGGSTSLRQRLARMDVAEFKLGVEQIAVSADQIRFRLLLAGLQPAQFRLSGAARVVVVDGDDPIAARRILGAAAQALRTKHANLGRPRDLVLPMLELHPLDRVRLEAKIPAVTQQSGSARADVTILVNGRMREIVPVVFETEKEPLLKTTVDPKVRSAMFTPASKGEILIKARDQVRIVALIGSAQVVATGEAQEDGRLGDKIRVRNTESNKVVIARVETREVVVVEY